MEAEAKRDQSIYLKLLAPIKLLLRSYSTIIKQEFDGESKRVLSSVVMALVAVFFLFNLVLLLNALAVFLLQGVLDNWIYAAGIVIVGQVVLGVLFFLLAKSSLKKPFFPHTKRLLSDTYSEISR